MLVLGRKENQSIIIGDNIRITIIGRSGSSIRIGVQAPSDVKVIRAELERQTTVDGSATQVSPPATSTPATSTLAVTSPAGPLPARASRVRASSVRGGESTTATTATATATAATTPTDVTCGDLASLMGAS